MPVAIIDLGTNTFHLLIAELESTGFKEIFRERRFIKLGEHSTNYIGPQAFQRGLIAMQQFTEICKSHKVNEIHAIGTAMLRNAINTPSFIEAVLESTGIPIRVIDGLEEARLIFKGVQYSKLLSGNKDLLMDIGGGSVEFIFSAENNAVWLDSIDIGVSVLKHRFPVEDNFSPDNILKLEKYLEFKLNNIIKRLIDTTQLRLIGISGTFDVIYDHFLGPNGLIKNSEMDLSPEQVIAFCNEIIPMNLQKKLNHPSIPESRADLISYALVLVKKIIQQSRCIELKVSQYSIKEGKLADLV